MQVIGGILLCVMYWAATGALLSKYHKIPSLVAAAIFSIIAGFLHIAQSVWLCRAVKVTQIAREAINFGNSATGNSIEDGGSKATNDSVTFQKGSGNIILDPTQTVY